MGHVACMTSKALGQGFRRRCQPCPIDTTIHPQLPTHHAAGTAFLPRSSTTTTLKLTAWLPCHPRLLK